MKTKTSILTALIALASGAGAMAQVYSQNIVGYVNVNVPTGYSMLANPLMKGDVSLPSLLPSPPEETTVFKFQGGGYISAAFIDGQWEGSAITLAPGEGAFFLNPTASPFTATFVGEVVLDANVTISQGYSILSSPIPQTGLLSTDLLFPAQEEDAVFKWTGTGYSSFAFIDNAWEPSQPTVGVGESFFLQRVSAAVNPWVRTFTVN